MVGLASADDDVAAGPVAVDGRQAHGELGGTGEEPPSPSEVDHHRVGADDDPANLADQGCGHRLTGIDRPAIKARTAVTHTMTPASGGRWISIGRGQLIEVTARWRFAWRPAPPTSALAITHVTAVASSLHWLCLLVEVLRSQKGVDIDRLVHIGRVAGCIAAEGVVDRAGIGVGETADGALEGFEVHHQVRDDLGPATGLDRRRGPLEDGEQRIETPLTRGAGQILDGGGEIALAPVGSNGFGFDPVMFIPEFGQTFAQLPVSVKNANSHRGRAARQMMALMQERWLA